jgi:hypothetical protein
MSPESCLWSFGQAIAGDDDGDDTGDPVWSSRKGVLAKAPAAFRFGTSKKRRRSGAAGGWATQLVGSTTICRSQISAVGP